MCIFCEEFHEAGALGVIRRSLLPFKFCRIFPGLASNHVEGFHVATASGKLLAYRNAAISEASAT